MGRFEEDGVCIMCNEHNNNAISEELEHLYEKYFNNDDLFEEIADESGSLLQPSPLEYVESYTSCGITDDSNIKKR